jgi:hypothetical protein
VTQRQTEFLVSISLQWKREEEEDLTCKKDFYAFAQIRQK